MGVSSLICRFTIRSADLIDIKYDVISFALAKVDGMTKIVLRPFLSSCYPTIFAL